MHEVCSETQNVHRKHAGTCERQDLQPPCIVSIHCSKGLRLKLWCVADCKAWPICMRCWPCLFLCLAAVLTFWHFGTYSLPLPHPLQLLIESFSITGYAN